jgi:PIH1 CS-like domain
MELDIGEKHLTFHVPNKYELEVVLPFPVVESKGTAKFEKNKRELTVTLPVVPNDIEVPKVCCLIF